MTVSYVLLRVLERDLKMTNVDSGELFDYFKYHFAYQRGRVSGPTIRTKQRAPRTPRAEVQAGSSRDVERSPRVSSVAEAAATQAAALATEASPMRSSSRKRSAVATASSAAVSEKRARGGKYY